MASKVAPARTADTMLRRIEEFFLTAPGFQRKLLWDILCALRGPDIPLDDPRTDPARTLKGRTTARVRTLAFPLLAAEKTVSYGFGSQFAARVDAPNLEFSESGASSIPHFASHIIGARHALKEIGRFPRDKKGS